MSVRGDAGTVTIGEDEGSGAAAFRRGRLGGLVA